MSTITWNDPAKLLRGVVVEGIDAGSFSASSATECWSKVASLCQQIANLAEPISVVCEIWPDTGRIIWILRDSREVCRLELAVAEIERQYFAILRSPNFESDYEQVLSRIKGAMRAGAKEVDLRFANTITMRDSDDLLAEEKV